ncbi:MAG: DEAD/DEAH box helicase [Pseudobdellovibrionaceae bacterium]
MSNIWAKAYRNTFEPMVQNRGRAYFQSGRVNLEFLENNVAKFKVHGTIPYMVEISHNLEDQKLSCTCTCAYFSVNTPCKHVWAAILQTDKNELFEVKGRGAFGEDTEATSSWKLGLLNAQQRLRSQIKFEDITAAKAVDQAQYSGIYALDLDRSREHKRLYLQILTQVYPPRIPPIPPKIRELGISSIVQFPSDADQEILQDLLGKTELYGTYDNLDKEKRFSTVVLPKEHAVEVLQKIGKSEKLYRLPSKKIFFSKNSPVEVEPYEYKEQFWGLQLELKKLDENYYLLPFLRCQGEAKPLREVEWAFGEFIFFQHFMAKSDVARHSLWVEFFGKNKEVEILAEELNDFLEYYFHQSSMPLLRLPSDLVFTELEDVQPVPRISLTALKPAQFGVGVEFLYGEQEASMENRNEFIYNVETKQKIRRHPEFEAQVVSEIQGFGLQKPARVMEESFDFILRESQFVKVAEQILARKWQLLVAQRPVTLGRIDRIEVQTSGVDWFSLQADFHFGGQKFGLPQLLGQLQTGSRIIELGDGSTGILPEEWIRKFGPLVEMGQLKEDKLQINKLQALFVSAQLEGHEKFQADTRFKSLGALFLELQNLKPQESAEKFQGQLRPYQQKGLAWLDLISQQGIGGILADDMGLGKTIQVIALFVAHQPKTTAKNKKPHLIVAPKSLVFNWIKELEKFAPHLKSVDFTGKNRVANIKDLKKYDVVLTTYQTLRMNIESLQSQEFDFFVMDEAHYIKNAEAQSSKACRLVKAKKKLALTGTPVENSLMDLFSILEVVSPGLITREVRARYSREKDVAALNDLGKALRPFVLRRTKDEVLKDLPEKSEQILYCELSASERTKYDELKKHYWNQLSGSIENKSFEKTKFEVLEALLRLRQAACHQGLLNTDLKEESSSKFDLLLDQLSLVIQDGHKALIFSQFTSLLALLKPQLEARGIRYEYLDGQTRDRQERVERFQDNPEIPLFLLSLKAGGVGLNLTSADYVFILDPWWNPAAESQAIDRAHRIGQKQKVFAYKIIAKDTVEEKILELQKSKKQLAKAIVSGGDQGLLKNMSMDDLRLLLG